MVGAIHNYTKATRAVLPAYRPGFSGDDLPRMGIDRASPLAPG